MTCVWVAVCVSVQRILCAVPNTFLWTLTAVSWRVIYRYAYITLLLLVSCLRPSSGGISDSPGALKRNNNKGQMQWAPSYIFVRRKHGRPTNTGVDLSDILGSNQNIGAKGSNNWWSHRRFLIVGRYTCPGCPPKSTPMGTNHVLPYMKSLCGPATAVPYEEFPLE